MSAVSTKPGDVVNLIYARDGHAFLPLALTMISCAQAPEPEFSGAERSSHIVYTAQVTPLPNL